MGPLEKGLVIIQVNGEPVSAASSHVTDGAWYSGDATSAMMFLEVGDRVWATLEDGSLHSNTAAGAFRNTFTGFLYAQM